MSTPALPSTVDVAALFDAAAAGRVRAVARLLTLAEDPATTPLVRSALRTRTAGSPAHVVGVTGAAGVGKSSTVAALVPRLRDGGDRVAVVAVDPSSPVTGGALLGDRVRMRGFGSDPGVYIRSLANRGQVGGLSRAVPLAVRVLEAVGFGTVVVETVGAGQSEVDVIGVADTVVVVCAPGLGDDVQAAKAGLLEVADLYAVNKADEPGAAAVVRDLRRTAALARGADPGQWRRTVVRTVARDGDVPELAEAIAAHRAWLVEGGRGARRRAERERAAVRTSLVQAIDDLVRSPAGEAALRAATDRVLDGGIDEAGAARALLTVLSASTDR